MATAALAKPSKLDRMLAAARELFERAATVGLDSDLPLTDADIREREYLHHLSVGALLAAVEEVAKQ